MTYNYLLSCLFVISSYFFATSVTREAIVGGTSVRYICGHLPLPYQVSVQVHGHGHVCGGGIIDERFILTAAHCVLNHTRDLRNSHIFILAGTDSLKHTDPPAVTKRVDSVFFPKEFHPTMEFQIGDIAVLRLQDALNLDNRKIFRKLNLPRNDQSHRSAMIAGFGWQVYNTTDRGDSDGQLQSFGTDILSEPQCQIDYPYGAVQIDRHICARNSKFRRFYRVGEVAGACIGDDGGPLVDHRSNEITVIGILSKIVPHCDEEVKPAIYTRVIHYVRMIFNVMERGQDSEMISLHTYLNP